MAERQVTELVVDGRGTVAGLAEIDRAYQKTGAIAEATQAKMNAGMAQQMQMATGVPQSVDRVGNAYRKLQASMDPVLKAQHAMEREMTRSMALIDRAVMLGVTTQVEAARTLSQLRQRQIADIDRVKQAQLSANVANQNVSGLGSASQFNTANIAAQFQDIGVTAAMGMSPLQIALQQGTQISAVLGPMGAAGAVRSLGAALISIFNPVSLVTLGLVAAAAAAIQYFMSWKSEAADSAETLKKQNELIAQVAGQWEGAVPALSAYNDELKRTGDLQDAIAAGQAASQQQYAPSREQVPGLNVDIADAVDMLSRLASQEDLSRVVALQGAFDALASKVRDSTATGQDALAVSQQLTELLGTYGVTAIGDYAGKFAALAEQLDASAEKARKFREEAAMLAQQANLGPLNPLDGFNRTPFQTEEEIMFERSRRQREEEENKRLGSLVPTPTRRPNLEDEPSRGASQLANRADSIEMLKLELSLVGQTQEARAKQIAVLSAEQDIRRAGIDLHGQEAAAIRAAAVEQVELSQKLTAIRAKEAQELQAQKQLQTSIFSTADDLMKKLIDGTFTWQDALESVLLLLLDIVKQAINMPGGNSWAGFLNNLGGMFGGGNAAPGAAAVDPWSGMRAPSNDNYAPGSVTRAPLGGASAYRDAIALIESAGSGDYSAIGPTHPKLGRALGRYQVIEANIGPWSKQALGRSIGADEFLRNPGLQDSIFDNRFGGYVNKYGERGAAQAWFGGEGSIGKLGRTDVLGTSVGGYGDKFMAALDKTTRPLETFAAKTVDASSGVGDFAKVLTGGTNAGGGLFGLGLSNTGSGFMDGRGGGLMGMLGGLGGGVAPAAGGGGILGWLMSLFGLPGFAAGGYTGSGGGIVHPGEVVFSPRDISRHGGVGAVEAMRTGYGGRDGARSNVIVFENTGTPQKLVEQREEQDDEGGRRIVYVLADQVTDAMNRPGTSLHREMRSRGAAPARKRRS